jgi:hypothetical protein
MQTTFQIELKNGFRFSVEQDVKTVADVQRLLSKAQTKLAAVKKAVPEMADEQVAKLRCAGEQQRPAAAAAGGEK